jgi:hypothetical protein
VLAPNLQVRALEERIVPVYSAYDDAKVQHIQQAEGGRSQQNTERVLLVRSALRRAGLP